MSLITGLLGLFFVSSGALACMYYPETQGFGISMAIFGGCYMIADTIAEK